MEAGVSPVKLKLMKVMKKIKEFISAFIEVIKDLTLSELWFFTCCLILPLLFLIIGLTFAIKETFFEPERKYTIRDVSGGIYYIDEYVKESDGTIKIEYYGKTYILNGYTIIILNDKKE